MISIVLPEKAKMPRPEQAPPSFASANTRVAEVEAELTAAWQRFEAALRIEESAKVIQLRPTDG
jgi:hypothetical protein